MTYKELAEYILSLPAEIQEQDAYLETDEGVCSVREVSTIDIEIGEESHHAWNTSLQKYVKIVDKESIKVKALTIL